MKLFSSDPEVIEYGTECLRIVTFGYVFFGYGMVIVQAFNGAGDSRTPTILNLFGYWMFQIPLAYVMAMKLGFGASGSFFPRQVASRVH